MLGLACAMVSSFKEPSGHADFSWMHPTVERIKNHQSKQANSQVFCGSNIYIYINIYIYSQRPHQDLPISCFNGIYAMKCVFPKPENGLLFSFHLKILKLKTFKNTSFFGLFFKHKKKRFLRFGYWQGRCCLHKPLFPLHDHNPEEKPYQTNILCYGKQAPLFPFCFTFILSQNNSR